MRRTLINASGLNLSSQSIPASRRALPLMNLSLQNVLDAALSKIFAAGPNRTPIRASSAPRTRRCQGAQRRELHRHNGNGLGKVPLFFLADRRCRLRRETCWRGKADTCGNHLSDECPGQQSTRGTRELFHRTSGPEDGRVLPTSGIPAKEDAERQAVGCRQPPDILLTNFMMLELLMTRQDDLDRASWPMRWA